MGRPLTEVVRALPVPALLLDAGSVPLAASDAFLRLVGMGHQELSDAGDRAVWWSDGPRLTTLVAQVCDLRRPASAEGQVTGAGGPPVAARVDLTPLTRADGRTAALCVVSDRSAEVRLSDRLRVTIDSGLDALMVFTATADADGSLSDAVLVDAGPRAADLLDVRLGAALGRPLSRIADPASAAQLLEMFAQARRDQRVVAGSRRLKLGSLPRATWLRVQVTPAGDDELIVMARDVTRERTFQDALHAALEHLRCASMVTRLVRDEQGLAVDAVIVDADHIAASELGVGRDMAVGTPLSRLMPVTELAALLSLHDSVVGADEPRDVGSYPVAATGGDDAWRLTPLPEDAVLAVRIRPEAGLADVDAADLVRSGFDTTVVGVAVRDHSGGVGDADLELVHLAEPFPGVAAPTGVGGWTLRQMLAEPGASELLSDIAEALRERREVERVRDLSVPGASPDTIRRMQFRCVPLRGDRFAASWRSADAAVLSAVRLRQVLEGGMEGFHIVEPVRDDDGRIVDAVVVEANERIASQLGTTRARLLGSRLSALGGGPVLERTLAEIEQVLDLGRSSEQERAFTVSGAPTRWVRYQLLPLDGAVAMLSRDVTDDRRAAEELRRLAEQLSFVARHASETISLHAPDGRFQFVSDAARRVWRRSPGELLGHNGLDFVHPADRELVADSMSRIRTGDAADQIVTARVMCPEGGTADLDLSIRAVRGAQGELEAFLWVSSDAGPRLDAERRAAERVEESARRAAEQAALRRVATAAAGAGSMESVLDIAAREAALLLEADVGLVGRFEDDSAVVVGTSRPDLEPTLGDSFPIAHVDALADVVRFGRGARADRPPRLPGTMPPALGHVSAVAAPVRVEGRLWGGILAATLDDRPLPEGVEARLARFAEIIELALAAADARGRLAAQAVTDALTGLANHRAFHERLREELARSRRHGRPMSLAVMDIDNFKRLNDVHGHQAGDEVLAEVARRLRDTARTGEVVARIGGEEFGWVLPETDAAGAMEAVERARLAVAASPCWGHVTVTISAGVADTEDSDDAAELFRLADGALYWAKADGRDSARRYSPEGTQAMSAEDRAMRLERGQTLVALRSLARAVDAKDPATHQHSERVAAVAEALALRLGWPMEDVPALRDAALLHDVGKIGVPDAVLLSPVPLDESHAAMVQRHAALGAEIASDALSRSQCDWIRHHHERWDGAGYPDGLSGEGIPEGARIIAVADAWDAMTAARHHGPPLTVDDALEELRRNAGTQFWPPAVEVLPEVLGRG